MPNYEDLKKTLKGKDGYLFLINDTNYEIEQHFNSSYKNKFNANIFEKDLIFKKKYCRENNIDHYFFIVPDKSLVCKDFLPFDVKIVKRNYDSISHLIPDFIQNLNPSCYFKNDTHINSHGGSELSYCILNHINNSFTREDFEKLIDEQQIVDHLGYNGDLTYEQNWSYSDEEKVDYLDEKKIRYVNKYLLNLNDEIPAIFKFSSVRETNYYKNEHSFTNLRALIFHDSSINLLTSKLGIYFREMLLYWDHWSFSKDVIEWFKPDIILEIRTERFLENMLEINRKKFIEKTEPTSEKISSDVDLVGVDFDSELMDKMVDEFSKYKSEYDDPNNKHTLHKNNPAFGPVDLESFYCMIRAYKPRKIIAICPPESTNIAAYALKVNKIKDKVKGTLTTITESPNAELEKNYQGDEYIKSKIQNIDLSLFDDLKKNDILFIDSSHMVESGGDVLFEYLKILPRLNSGVLVHIHDIFLPSDYPKGFGYGGRGLTEQYLLQAFLTFNKEFEIIFGSSYFHKKNPHLLETVFDSYDQSSWPASFWIKRK